MVGRSIWLLTFFMLMILSYIREVLFRSLNAILDNVHTFYAKTIEIPFFLGLSKAELLQYKYIFTLLFTLLFMLLTILGLRYSNLKKRPHILAMSLYGIFLFLAFILLILSFFSGDFESFYPFLRILIGLIHNPLVFILISISAFSLQNIDNV